MEALLDFDMSLDAMNNLGDLVSQNLWHTQSLGSLPDLGTFLATPVTIQTEADQKPDYSRSSYFDQPTAQIDDQCMSAQRCNSVSRNVSVDVQTFCSTTALLEHMDVDAMQVARRFSGETDRDFNQRKSASDRERSRMRDMNRAFDMLRHKLSHRRTTPGKRLSKIQALRFAIQYIADLEDILAVDSPSDEHFYAAATTCEYYSNQTVNVTQHFLPDQGLYNTVMYDLFHNP